VTEPDTNRGRFGYQPALDGVRALAVGAVLVFHGLPALLPGGFLGVDAFFVLSGFLITALLLAERERTGRIRLGAFWWRRARRLLPALLLLLAAVVGGARWFSPAEELASVRADVLATLGYVANWRMIYRGDGYFDTTAATSVLQHAWSLGIEEQFYLLWPLAVLLLRSRLAIGVAAVAGTVASTVAAAWLFDPAAPDRAYFGTDTRAAALLVGCATAAALPRLAAVRSRALTAGAVVVVGAGWAGADGTERWLYHGGFAALAVAVAVVLAHLVRRPDGPFGRVLGVAPLVALGRISYGVYLWHWPLYGVLTGARTGLTGPALLAVRIAVTVAVAAYSYLLVERPVLQARRLRWRLALPVTAVATAVVVGLALSLPASAPAPAPATAAQAGPVDAQPPVSTSGPGSVSSAPPGGVSAPPPAGQALLARPGRTPGGPRVLLLGDSVAWSLGNTCRPIRGSG
jgi:peptidoglycan/LPS O-acetylase OafA/YrhL